MNVPACERAHRRENVPRWPQCPECSLAALLPAASQPCAARPGRIPAAATCLRRWAPRPPSKGLPRWGMCLGLPGKHGSPQGSRHVLRAALSDLVLVNHSFLDLLEALDAAATIQRLGMCAARTAVLAVVCRSHAKNVSHNKPFCRTSPKGAHHRGSCTSPSACATQGLQTSAWSSADVAGSIWVGVGVDLVVVISYGIASTQSAGWALTSTCGWAGKQRHAPALKRAGV